MKWKTVTMKKANWSLLSLILSGMEPAARLSGEEESDSTGNAYQP